MKQKPLKWIYNYIKKYIWAIFLLTVISGIVAVSFILLALVSSSLLDIATGHKSGSILLQCFYLAGLIIMQVVLNILFSNLKVRVSGKIEMGMKQNLLSKLFKKQYLQVTKMHSGEIMNRFTSDLQIVVNNSINIVVQAVSMGTKLIGGLFVLMSINMFFTSAVISLGMVMFFFSRLYRNKFRHLHRKCQETEGKTRSFIQEAVENIVVIKSFVNDNVLINKMSDYQRENYAAKIKFNAVSNAANTSAYMMLTSGYFMTLAWGAFQISAGTMTFGTLTAFLQIIEQIKAPFRNMSSLTPQYYAMLASAERLIELEELEDEAGAADTIDVKEAYESLECIKLENIHFGYTDRKVLEDTSLTVNKGEIIAIAGESGAGKSTLIKLMLGLVTPHMGKAAIITEKRQLTLDAGTRKLFSYVPQSNMILSGTIRENVSFFNSSISDESIISALKTACMWEYVRQLQAGLGTVLGERGAGLSEGQVQRMAIARAVLSDAPILLLDECTSALDEVTEARVLKNIKALKTKTVIYISHKEATLNSCDRIIYM